MLDKSLKLLKKIEDGIEKFKQIIQVIKNIIKGIFYLLCMIYILILSIQIEIIRNWVLNLYENELYKNIINWLYLHTNLSLFIILCILIVLYFYRIWKIGKEGIAQIKSQIDNNADFAQQLHLRFIHDIRDNIKELDNAEEILCNGNDDVIRITRDNMFCTLANNMQNYVDFISELLTEYCKTTVSVCVKIVKIENNDINNPLATTLVRSTNTRKKRMKSDENVEINENDDFKYLYNGANTFFAASDLVTKHNDGKYKVKENIEVWKDKYKSTLIAPIRYYSKHSQHNNVNVEFEILGFLCIDANQIMPEWEDIDSYELKILAIFADVMYMYLKRYKDAYCVKKRAIK